MPANTYAEASQYGDVLYRCNNKACHHEFYKSYVLEEYLGRDQPTRCPNCRKAWSHLVLEDGKPVEKAEGVTS